MDACPSKESQMESDVEFSLSLRKAALSWDLREGQSVYSEQQQQQQPQLTPGRYVLGSSERFGSQD